MQEPTIFPMQLFKNIKDNLSKVPIILNLLLETTLDVEDSISSSDRNYVRGHKK